MDGFEASSASAQHLVSRVLMLTARGRGQEPRDPGSNWVCGRLLAKAIRNGGTRSTRKRAGRRYPEEPTLKLSVGDLTLDLASHEVHRGARHIHLSVRELMLLKVLMREPGGVFTRT